MTKDIHQQVHLFNQYDDSHMEVVEHGVTTELFIDGKSITCDWPDAVYKRVEGINREHGYHYFEE